MNRWFGQALACKATSDMCISACDANKVWPGFPCVHCFAFCGFHCFIVAVSDSNEPPRMGPHGRQSRLSG